MPQKYSNLQLHVLRAHLQMILWKAADQRHLPVDARDICRFCWDVKEGGVVIPSASNALVAPHGLLDVVSCSCIAERKACSEKRCSCHSARLSCMEYFYCEGCVCCSPFNKHTEEDQLAEDMQEDDREADDHNHIVSATALIHRTARPSISAMSSLLGISPKCVKLVMIWFRSHVAAPHIQCLFSR